uniref:RRM domain-containing protein n=1 Tax=Alexandrium catenella TaxID=2925 RepID=A0A7S1S019_ALECA|mmetsp:Transcript_78128/g.207350  ORF Transcript_78128/g.207350 Transcript_78128/m.207350 type:complete len:387 (+) Transcript_78128:57-1217(+)
MVAGGGGNSACLSVFGLPYDAAEREVHVLFSGCPGYNRCIVVPGKGSQRPYAFVQFGEQQDALSAMESRQGTTWEEGVQPVSIELAKRDIPDKFQPRQVRQYPLSDQADYNGPSHGGAAVPPPAKRPRQEALTQYGNQSEGDGPRTIHLGGLPLGLSQADLDHFLQTNFGDSCLGGSLDAKGGAMAAPRAFVGFASHQAASEAQGMLEGFNWDGAQLRAEWARTEFRPQGAGGGRALAAPVSVPPPRGAPAGQRSWEGPPSQGRSWEVAPPSGHRSWEGASPAWDQPRGGGQDRGGAVKCTLHFTNLPFMSEDDFSNFLGVTFPDQIVCAHFKDSRDGRPPVAWVLFTDDGHAAAAAHSHHSFDLQGSQVLVQYARTELDPSKFRR